MSASPPHSVPPLPPRAPAPQTRHVLWIVAAIIFVLIGGTLIVGLFSAEFVLREMHITDRRSGGREHVAVSAPFGALRVDAGVPPDQLGLRVYPGAALVPSEEPSAFVHGLDLDGRRLRAANVELDLGDMHLRVRAAEFQATASPEQVLAFYRTELARHGAVQQTWGPDDEVQLKVKLSDANVWVVATRPWSGATRFALVHVSGGGTA